ncbi:hypothetical protein [Streptomyces xanthochromogenes]
MNCNLQRLDGPVRGNGKIIQELEGTLPGRGLGRRETHLGRQGPGPLFARDKEGILRRVMEETVDGEYQAYKANDGKFVREKFFGKHPKLLEMVSRMSDEDVWRLNRGGHDPHKVYAAFASAASHTGQPSVILAKTSRATAWVRSARPRTPLTSRKSSIPNRCANSAIASTFPSPTTRSTRFRSSNRPKIRRK